VVSEARHPQPSASLQRLADAVALLFPPSATVAVVQSGPQGTEVVVDTVEGDRIAVDVTALAAALDRTGEPLPSKPAPKYRALAEAYAELAAQRAVQVTTAIDARFEQQAQLPESQQARFARYRRRAAEFEAYKNRRLVKAADRASTLAWRVLRIARRR
jgi:hypothetical protein